MAELLIFPALLQPGPAIGDNIPRHALINFGHHTAFHSQPRSQICLQALVYHFLVDLYCFRHAARNIRRDLATRVEQILGSHYTTH